MLYTIVPQEMIYQTEQKDYEKQKTAMYNGIPVIVEVTDDNEYQIVRVLSSDPSVFLDNSCMPGTKIRL